MEAMLRIRPPDWRQGAWHEGGGVPDPFAGAEAGGKLREVLRSIGAPVEPAELAAHLGWPVTQRRMYAPSGGHEALLVPRSAGGFSVVVDPRPSPVDHWSDAFLGLRAGQARARFRIAHELAHSLFYSASAPPQRLLPASAEEENFCDALAAAFLTRAPERSPSARSLVSMAMRDCVPVFAAAILWASQRVGRVAVGGWINHGTERPTPIVDHMIDGGSGAGWATFRKIHDVIAGGPTRPGRTPVKTPFLALHTSAGKVDYAVASRAVAAAA